ncbi:MAG: hypothetical protein JNL41_12375 [Phenylobacterium sp.]|uniref:nidogen-like domain-containing protein n=1 Tax=Phenylobacterium sp. TaxID=1871053 RepID=UPI001A4A125E|nr:nidogen-like domain-containing protein [Phenylobacterium sp.]MBL8555069.1 hypothetical protein [Phenylobacterium sp.]
MPDLVNGLGGAAGFGENVIPRNDDGSSAAINITSIFGNAGLNFFGSQYTTLYVNNNGNITFGGALSQYIGAPIGAGGLTRPIIAAYWFDVDTRGGVDTPSPGGTSTGSNLVYYDLDTTGRIFTATWDDTGYYASHIGAPNAFQIRLTDVGNGDFDIEFIYETINRSYSDTNQDPGEAPRAGYARGNGTPGVELALSGDYNTSLLLDTEPGNTGVAGYYYFQVRGGVVMGGVGNGPGGGGDPTPPSRPVVFGVEPIGLMPEGNEGQTTRFNVVITRDGPDLDAGSSAEWRIAVDDLNDLAPNQPLSGTVFFEPFQTRATVVVEVQGDNRFEDDEWFHFHINEVRFNDLVWDPGIDTVGVILNDDPAARFEFAGPAMRPEGLIGDSPIEFVVLRTGDLTRESAVRWNLENGTTDSLDFAADQATSGVVVFAAGQAQAVIRVNLMGDVRVEPDETFTLRLVSATTGTTTTVLDVSTTGTILDDDARQTLLVASPSALVLAEGNSGTTAFNIAVMRVGDVSAAANISYAISLPASGGLSAGEIQTALQGTVSFAAGSSEATLSVLVAGDTIAEDNESFVVTLGGGVFNTLTVTGVVMNDDKVATAAAGPTEPSGALPAEASAFMLQLMGGGLWSDGAMF